MAFVDQVQDLTSLTVSDNDELSQFLKDGVIDVTNRWLAIRPQDIELFGRETTISDSQGVSVGGAKIISVIREAGADGSSDGSTAWEPCRKIPSSMQSRAVDVDSLNYASAYNPVYTINSDKTINVYPVPSSNNGFKVFYVNEEPRDISNNAALIHSHSNIKYFPNDKVYLVVMYAGIKLIHATLAAKSVPSVPVSQVLPTLSITASEPAVISLIPAPSLTSVTFTSIDSSLDANASVFSTATISAASTYTGSAPTYTKPTLVLGTAPTISNLSITAVPPDTPSAPSFTGTSVIAVTNRAISASAPTFTKPTIGGTADELTDMTALDSENTIDDFDGNAIEVDQWFATAAHLIEDEED